MEHATELNECLCCGRKHLTTILDLGEQPLANSFKVAAEDEELKFPLRLNLCRVCSHTQLSHAVDPDLLFKNYLYVSGTSKTYLEYMDWFVNKTKEYVDYRSPAPTTVLDIACNDGSQLDAFKRQGFTTYGIDPAENLHKISSAKHEVICDYFYDKHVPFFKEKKIDIINAQNVFAHTNYPLEFLQMCGDIMHDDSRLYIQTSQADMIRNNEFDTIYHEHLSFFNITSMYHLVNRAGLFLIDVVKTPIHGTSFMFVISKIPGNQIKLLELLDEESQAGLQNFETYTAYADKCRKVVDDLKTTINDYRGQGYVIAGYGAAAKGMTLINFGDLYLDFIIDDNPLKQGLFCPGSGIPVVPIDMLDQVKDMKVVFIPLAWNLFTEIKNKIKAVRDNKDDVFIKYFPGITID